MSKKTNSKNGQRILTAEEEKELFRKYTEEGDMNARNEIIECNMNLVRSVAYDHRTEGVEVDDLISDGYIGLMTAVDKFDYTLGYKFSTYAMWWIRQAVNRSIADNSRTIRLPVHVHEKVVKINRFTREFEEEFSRKPTAEEISKGIGMSAKDIETYLSSSGKIISLQDKVGEDGAEVMDFIECEGASPEEVSELEDRDSRLRNAVNTCLTDKERFVIVKRFGMFGSETLTLVKVGELLGLTRERVRQIECDALRKLKKELRDDMAA